MCAETLPQYTSKLVRLVGRVKTAPAGGRMVLTAADGQDVSVRTGKAHAAGSVVEVIGNVAADASVDETVSTTFNEDFDLELYNRMLKLANHPFNKPMFMSA